MQRPRNAFQVPNPRNLRERFSRAVFQLGLCAGLALVGCGDSTPTDGNSSDDLTPTGNGGGNAGPAGTNGGSTGATPSGGGTSTGTGGNGAGQPGVGPGGASGQNTGGVPAQTMGGTSAGGATPTTVTDDFVSNVAIAVHAEVRTILVVSWTQEVTADQVLLEFTFETGNVMRSRPVPGVVGDHQDVVLGVPAETDVTVRIVSSQGGTEFVTSDQVGTTGTIPAGFPLPDLTTLIYEPTLASEDRWLFGSVEDSIGGSGSQANYLGSTFWLYIMDRRGRIVWYFSEPGSNTTSSFQRIARDGEYIWIERRCFGCGAFDESVLKRSLDGAYSEEIQVAGLADCIDVTTDGSLLYNTATELMELPRGSTTPRVIWSCTDYFGAGFNCYTNTINWNPEDDTILMSFPDPRTILQVNRSDGEVVGQYGASQGSQLAWDFAPPLALPPTAWSFGFQHFPNISPTGTLMVSSHMPGFEPTTTAVANQHAFVEFAIDTANQMLTEVWRYTDGPEWARSKGMAIRLAGGNTLANYGTGGVIREITPDKQTAFYVKFDVAGGDDFYNKLVGHNELINDLYALNGGGPL